MDRTLSFLGLIVFIIYFIASDAAAVTPEGCLNQTHIDNGCKYHRIGEKGYYLFNRSTTWEENRQWCMDLGLEMVRLTRETVPDILKLQLNDFKWLAGKANNFSDWTFVNNTPVSSTWLDFIDPGKENWHQCGFLNSRNNSLMTDLCNEAKSFLCRFGDEITAYQNKMDWFTARETCLLKGGDLFYLNGDDDEEGSQQQIDKALKVAAIPENATLHIGVTHRSWEWPNGDPIVSKNMLSNGYNEGCLNVGTDDYAVWHDWFCDREFGAFCQKNFVTSPIPDLTTMPDNEKNIVITTPDDNRNILMTTPHDDRNILIKMPCDNRNIFMTPYDIIKITSIVVGGIVFFGCFAIVVMKIRCCGQKRCPACSAPSANIGTSRPLLNEVSLENINNNQGYLLPATGRLECDTDPEIPSNSAPPRPVQHVYGNSDVIVPDVRGPLYDDAYQAGLPDQGLHNHEYEEVGIEQLPQEPFVIFRS